MFGCMWYNTAMVNKKTPKKVTIRQLRAAKIMVAKGGSWKKAMIEAGFSEAYAKNPQKMLKSTTFEELTEKFLPDYKLLSTHTKQLNAHRLDHMVFPPEGSEPTDQEITDMLLEVGCTVRKIVHGELSRHVYFWAADNKAQLGALELGYKIKNKMPQAKPSVIVPVQVNVHEDREKYA